MYEINQATRFYMKIAGQYTVHLPYQFSAAENAVWRSGSTVSHANHITTVLRTSEFTQVSPFSPMVTKSHFSWYAFLKHLETSSFHWRWFCRCMINRLSHTFPRTQNIFTNGALIPKIYSACSFADAMFSLGNFGETSSFLVFRACAEHFREQICIFLSFTRVQPV